MLLIPKGAPVETGVPAARDEPPESLGRLARARFTGYVKYTFAASLAVLLFENGRLISAFISRGGARLSGLEALKELCDRVATEAGTLDVYRLSSDLTMCVHALLHGDVLVKAQELRLVDVRALLAQLKEQQLNGCVRVYTEDRTALIFFRDGAGLGFFHDGAEKIERVAPEAQKIASLPGARLDVMSTPDPERVQAYDLLEVVNLDKVWEGTMRAHAAKLERQRAQAAEDERSRRDAQLTGLEEALRTTASEYLGAMGKNMVTKELGDRGGRACLLEPEKARAVLDGINRSAKLLLGASKVRELLDRLETEMKTRLGEDAVAGS